MKRTVAALALLSVLLLTACGEEKPPSSGAGVLTQAGGMPADTVVFTVDSRPVTAGQGLYWLADACDAIRAYYDGAGMALDWDAPLEGATLADYAKDQALQNAALYATVENWADQHGCALTEEDRAAMAADWAARAESAGGESAYLAQLARLGLDRAGADRLAGDHYLYLQLCALAGEADSALSPKGAELAEFYNQQGYLTVDVLLVSKDGAADQAALDIRRQKAESLFARLNGSADKEAAFSALAAETGSAGPQTLRVGDGALPAAFETAAAALAEGQVSGIVEAEESYGILLRLAPDLDAVRADWFDERLQGAAADAAIAPMDDWKTLSAADFCAKLDKARTALDAAK